MERDSVEMKTKKNSYIEKRTFREKLRVIAANKYIYFMILPVMLWYIIFTYLPMYGVTMAFKDFRPGGGLFGYITNGEWVGFKYFEQVMQDPLFWRAFKNTLIVSGMKLLVLFPFVIFVVLMLNELRFRRFKKLTQTVMYLPHFFSWVVIGGIFIQLLSVTGPVTYFLTAITGKEIHLLTDPKYFRWVLVASEGLKEMGWDTIIYLSALAGIPLELYEAANVDGANRAQRIWYITLPCLLPTIVTMLLIKVSFMINGNFDQVYMMYNSAVYETADIIDTYLYRVGLTSGKFSMATAMGLFKSVISVLMLVMSNTISKKLTGEGIF